MLFSETVEHVTIHKGVLAGECKKADHKSSIQSSISLNDFIGNVDGLLTWGGRGFSHSAESVQIVKGVLSAKLKNNAGKVIESKLDLNQHIQNVDGILGIIPITPSASAGIKQVDVVKASAPDLVREDSSASTASASGMFSAASAASAATAVLSSSTIKSSTSVSSSSATKYSSSSHFSTSQFRTTSKLLLIEDSCTKLELRGTHLHADCQRIDGSIQHSHIDLNEIIGFVNGHLVWDYKDFQSQVVEISLDGFFLVVKFHPRGKDDKHYHFDRIDLRYRLRNADGVIIIVELNKKLSVMLSEVPWMKFKVIAEPDLNLFAANAVVKETLTQIAETTVEHVTTQMHERLTIAMQAAIIAVTESAMSHVHVQMEKLVSEAVGYASASASITAAEHLHLYGDYRRGSHLQGGYAYGSGYANGHRHEEHRHEEHHRQDEHQYQHDEHHVLRDGHSYSEIAKHALAAHT
jgi:hypothetical protein